MNRKTLAALKGSIKKWKKIVDGTGEDLGAFNCPLCIKFLDDDCVGCPVAERTGWSSCLRTPYREYEVASRELGDRSPVAVELAKRELAFLKSLLPKVPA